MSIECRLENVSYQVRNKQIIDNAQCQLSPEGVTLLIGNNGSGKTTLLKLCQGLLEPTQGVIGWYQKGKRVDKVRCYMMFQKPLMLHRRVIDNIVFLLRAHGASKKQAIKKAEHVLEHCGILHLSQQWARALSGGEQQKLALARVWALEPAILLLDEPMANLDPRASLAIERLIKTLATRGCKIIMSTHCLDLISRLPSDLLFLDKGKLHYFKASTEFTTDMLLG